MKKMVVDAKQLDFWNKWLKENEIDFDKVDFSYDATLFCQTVELDDGACADELEGEWKYPFDDGDYDVEVVRG